MSVHKSVIQYLEEGDTTREYTVPAHSSLSVVLAGIDVTKVHASVTVRLAGVGARATIIGVIVGRKDADIHVSTLQRHEAPDTASNLLVKSALRDNARCIVDGAIRVEKNAQKTDAYQRNENLLLSEAAYAESKPALEILANDVRCTHGATVGPISEDELWFLKTRGISRARGEALIAHGFFNAALRLVDDESVRYRILEDIAGVL